jgi:xylan 1,4-beta-xylosidase
MPTPKYSRALTVERPIIPGFYPDPSIVRVGDTYYIANSSFEYAPGVPIHKSKDLINWTLAGHALHSRVQMNIDGQQNSGGIFAPTLRHHDGKFYMITTLTDGKWQLLVSADEVEGPWSEPVRIEIAGIDPDIFWDDNGDCYMTYASLALRGLAQVKIDPISGELLGEPYLVWQGNGGKFPEGPHIYSIGDWFYILIAEGGTERGHAVAIARSKNFNGPFEADPKGILLSNRGTDYKLQNTGHADLVERPDGSWAMVFHGTRPKGASPEWHVMGRETCAVEITWQDGWPQLGKPIEPDSDAVVIEELDSSSNLPASWISVGSWPVENTEQTSDGLLFKGFVARRQNTRHFEVTIEIDGEGPGGIGVGIDGRHHLGLLRDKERAWAQWTIGDHSFEIGSVPGKVKALRILSEEMTGGFTDPVGPDKLKLYAILEDGTEHEVAALDGRYLSTEVAGGMTGRVIGILAFTPTVLKKWHFKSLA